IPDHLVAALLAAEDRDYFHHHGIHLLSIGRALLANLRAGRAVQGGSTLTQQLVKNFYLTPERSLWRKANEALMAILLEWRYDKDEILEAYLNEIYLGQESSRAIHGFGLASRFYFDRPVQQLTTAQVATLVALVRGPSYYNPRRHPERLRKRRDLVLKIMADQGVISAGVARRASRTDLGIVRGTRSDSRHPAFLDLVRRQLQRDYRREDLTSAGLQIFTTFDPRIQQAAEQALSQRVKQLDRQQGLAGKLQGAVVVTDTTSGEVLALVADRQPRFAGFNRALDARRPIGSLIKPAVYLSALEQPAQYTLSTALSDTPIRLKGPNNDIWSPRNYDGTSHGTVPLFRALVHSYNQATVRLGMQLGFERIADTLQRLGAERDIPAYPSMLLGAVNFSPYEVTRMYQTLAAGGFRTPLRAIREVLTVEGEPLRRFPLDVEQVVDPASVAVLVSALHEVTRSGTARSLAGALPAGLSVAGKTGTTNDLRDSWFAGFSGDHLAVVWLGQDDNGSTGLTGSSGALRVWTRLMQIIPNQPLLPPATDEVEYHWIDGNTGLLSRQDCEGAVQLAYIRGSAPKEPAPCAATEDAGIDRTLDWFKGLFE
ncbi:MAG TPA: penicillin-binding protein 1B, partial [Chromatiales bacterium]|nr:penicillin-binding protein 1B [Chromatiales bacterium]